MYHRGKNSPRWKEKIKKICLNCHKSFKVKPSEIDSKFCCQKCYWGYAVNEKHWNWKGGIAWPFGAKLKEWVKTIYKRDNYTCQICGAGQDKKKNRLEAHHIYPKHKYPELVYNLDNGITLCQEHHIFFRGYELQFVDFFERLRDYRYGELNGET